MSLIAQACCVPEILSAHRVHLMFAFCFFEGALLIGKLIVQKKPKNKLCQWFTVDVCEISASIIYNASAPPPSGAPRIENALLLEIFHLPIPVTNDIPISPHWR